MDEALARQIEDAVREIADEAAGEAVAVIAAQQKVLVLADMLLRERGSRSNGATLLARTLAAIHREAPDLPPDAVAEALEGLATSINEARGSAMRDGVVGVRVQPGRLTPDGPVLAIRCTLEFAHRDRAA